MAYDLNEATVTWYAMTVERKSDGARTMVHRRYSEFQQMFQQVEAAFKGHHLRSRYTTGAASLRVVMGSRGLTPTCGVVRQPPGPARQAAEVVCGPYRPGLCRRAAVSVPLGDRGPEQAFTSLIDLVSIRRALESFMTRLLGVPHVSSLVTVQVFLGFYEEVSPRV
jgi:hypothetical protein